MADMAEAFDALASTELWESVAAIFAGFMAPTVLKNLTSGVAPDMVKDNPEVYGLAVAAGGQLSPMYSYEISIGGGLYTVDKAAERFDIKSTVQGVGA
ncbi:hypothetical protein ACFQFH_20075 [Halobaculum halobium]|uniref:Uncharacterized protein n=1 Tax=Halobaculum halobium TaxID=3032281 RepID=A0ABD5TGZ6_9EURY|nr:hypothetical protein [Halobaculum sp. SYNS20]